MNIYIFEDLVKTDIAQALDELTQDILKSEQYNSLLKQNKIDNGELMKESLAVVSGLFGSFTTALAIVETIKTNIELQEEMQLKKEYDKKPLVDTKGNKKPFNQSIANKTARAKTKDLRRIRNIIRSYKEMNERNISTLQSLLKAISVDKRLSNQID